MVVLIYMQCVYQFEDRGRHIMKEEGLKYVAWPNIQNRGLVLIYVMVMVLIYMQKQKYYEGGGLKYLALWPNIQNRGKHRPLRLMPPLTDMAPGKTLLTDISPTNDPKYLLAYLKMFFRSCTHWRKSNTNAVKIR